MSQFSNKNESLKKLLQTGAFLHRYKILEGMGAYGPLLLAPAEGLGGPSGPLICGEIYFNN